MIPGLCSLLNRRPGGSSGLSATAAPAYASKSGIGTITTAPVTVTPLGGVSPYTYAWAQVSGDPTIIISSPVAVTTRFIASVTTGDYKSGTFQCTVTDSASSTAVTNIVSVALMATNA